MPGRPRRREAAVLGALSIAKLYPGSTGETGDVGDLTWKNEGLTRGFQKFLLASKRVGFILR